MNFRHEWKHEINWSDLVALRQRLQAVTQPDVHAIDGKYFIRSLYFDDPMDTALLEKLDGINRREKFRIRYYNFNTDLIRLEKKSKWNGLCSKTQADLSVQETQSLVDGNWEWMANDSRPLLQELYVKMRNHGLQPKTIVDYTREAFFFPAGNTRITLDYDIRTGLSCTDFLNPDCTTIPVGNTPAILEVKWDEFLPSIIRDAVQLPGRHTASFSKYAACRTYG